MSRIDSQILPAAVLAFSTAVTQAQVPDCKTTKLDAALLRRLPDALSNWDTPANCVPPHEFAPVAVAPIAVAQSVPVTALLATPSPPQPAPDVTGVAPLPRVAGSLDAIALLADCFAVSLAIRFIFHK